MNLYKIYADYRVRNDHRYPYFVISPNKKQAKIKFHAKIPWLDIISVTMVEDKDRILEIVLNPDKYQYW